MPHAFLSVSQLSGNSSRFVYESNMFMSMALAWPGQPLLMMNM